MYYLAYGSNLHPLRLNWRVPNARFVGKVELVGYQLTFNKKSVDGSAKCSLYFTEDPNDKAYGAVFDVPDAEVQALDAAEGLGNGYYKQQVTLQVNNEPRLSFVYLASSSHIVFDLEPYDWYQRIVVAGAKKHLFPADYIEQIESTRSKPDHNSARRIRMENLLLQLDC